MNNKSCNIDIISINNKIIRSIKEKYSNIDEYKTQKKILKNFIKNNPNTDKIILNSVKESLEKTNKNIYEIENNCELNFYLNETIELISRYNQILKIPIKISFMGVQQNDNKKEKEKKQIIKDYIKIVNKYIEDNDLNLEEEKEYICDNCNSKNIEFIDENTFVCISCSTEKTIIKHISSYKDIDRVNICSKYTYNRKIHFRDCINQYQGKQNCSIAKEVYEKLENQFKIHSLLEGKKTDDKTLRYKRITKEIIMIFLKDLGYSKHYENINLIHYNITGRKPDDISHLEEKLLRDFDELTDLYDKLYTKKINRNNFINTQYVLYQLLKRHKHPCRKSDFSVLKTIDRIAFHDEVVKVLFQTLGWNHDSYF